MRKIGIIGCYSHDVILLLAKAVRCLGERVVLTDRNEAHVLSTCVPLTDDWKLKPYTEYKGIFFSSDLQGEKTDNESGVEFIDFGFAPTDGECNLCRDLIVICDMHMHHIRRIQNAGFPREKVRVCMLRDVDQRLLNREKGVTDFLTSLAAEKQIYLLPDDRDIRNRYVCELQYEYSLKNASVGMREAVFEAVCFLFPETEEKELRRRIRQVERREYR